MTDRAIIEGHAVALRIANLDTDQVMPKQFLTGIDKSGLARGLFYDFRFNVDGSVRPDFILNRPAYAGTSVLLAGPNFGCGSSREHAVWGLQQFGIRAVIASSFAEIFYSNAMNNGLMLVTLQEEEVQALMAQSEALASPLPVTIDVENLTVQSGTLQARFPLNERHRRMYLDGLDVIGASLLHREEIGKFAQGLWAQQPWLKDVARRTCERLGD